MSNMKFAHDVWRAALTLANNLCVQQSDYHNDRDKTLEASIALDCAERCRQYLELDDASLSELLDEAGVEPARSDPLPDSIQWALNSGDGTYRP